MRCTNLAQCRSKTQDTGEMVQLNASWVGLLATGEAAAVEVKMLNCLEGRRRRMMQVPSALISRVISGGRRNKA
jgi:hypothetical protein